MLLLKSIARNRSVNGANQPLGLTFPPQPPKKRPLLSLRIRVYHPNTRIYARLLGPCFRRVNENHFVSISCQKNHLTSMHQPLNKHSFAIQAKDRNRKPSGTRSDTYRLPVPQSDPSLWPRGFRLPGKPGRSTFPLTFIRQI